MCDIRYFRRAFLDYRAAENLNCFFPVNVPTKILAFPPFYGKMRVTIE
nr:hypothetical protein [uncultured Acetatifactor sp.]